MMNMELATPTYEFVAEKMWKIDKYLQMQYSENLFYRIAPEKNNKGEPSYAKQACVTRNFHILILIGPIS